MAHSRMMEPTSRGRESLFITQEGTPSYMIDALRVGRLFSTLDDDEYYKLMAEAQSLSISPGHELTRQGETVDLIYFIFKGRAKAEIWAENARRSWAVVDMLGPGDPIGLLSMIDGGPHSATVVALEQLQIIGMPLGTMKSTLLNHPEWYKIITEEVVFSLRNNWKWLQALL